MTARRVAALYDVHGNLPALEAVLDELADVAPDALVVVGGDFAPGPLPAETLDALRALGERAVFVRGNGERELLEPRGDPADTWVARTQFVAEALTEEQLSFLARVPETVEVAVEGLGRVLFCHATPRSDSEIVTRLTPDARFAAALAGVEADVVVCGHTHVRFDRRVGSTRIVNAGSVGMPYEGETGAYWALLGPDVELRRTPYDKLEAAEVIRATGFPQADRFVAEFVLRSYPPEAASEEFERLAAETASARSTSGRA